MDTFNWLHLTDLHWGLSDQRHWWPNIREEFFEKLPELHSKTGPWHAVLFTGDLVQQGSWDEFAALEDKVLGPLWEQFRSLGDLWDAERGRIAWDAVRRVTVPDALVDTGATMLSLPSRIIRALGLSKRQTRRAAVGPQPRLRAAETPNPLRPRHPRS